MKTKIIFISVFCLLLLTMSTAAFSQIITVSGAPAPYEEYNGDYYPLVNVALAEDFKYFVHEDDMFPPGR